MADDAPRLALSAKSSKLPKAMQLWRFWLMLAWHDWRRRYRRSALGAAWLFVSFALFVGVKIAIFGAMSSESMAFFAVWLSSGFLVWTYIQANLVEGCNVFISAARWIKGADLPYSIYVMQSVTRSIIQFALSGLVILIILFMFPPPSIPIALSAILSLPILVVSAVWSQLLLGVLCSRHRDLIHLTQTAVRLLFFLTPILWVPSAFGRFGELAVYNPFTHYIAIFRDPLVYGTIPWMSWGIVFAMTIVGVLLSVLVFRFNKNKIVFWI